MKKIFVLIILALMVSYLPTYATDKIRVSSEVYLGIKKYKKGNYAGCIQEMRTAIKKMKDDPSIPYYYMGNSYVKLGRPDDAKESYQKVVDLNKSSGLVNLSKGAIAYLSDTGAASKKDDMREFIESRKFLHNEVVKDLEDKDIQNVQNEINSKGEKEDSIDFNKYRYINDASGQNLPTDEEIATAVKILARVGYNPYAQQNYNSDYMTMMTMMGGQNNGNNNFSNMLPYLMAQNSQYGNNNQQNINQQMLQNMMLRGMTSGF